MQRSCLLSHPLPLSSHLPVPCSLEFSLDDYCTLQLARSLNTSSPSLIADFSRTSQFWRNQWYSKVRFFCYRTADNFFPACDKSDWPEVALDPWNAPYTEGDAWHWRWAVPQDVPALLSYGFSNNRTLFVQELAEFLQGTWQMNSTLLRNPWMWSGNEPDIHAPFLFNYAAAPRLTQKWTRLLQHYRYSSKPDGIPGNDDYGALSAWYVLATMGLYPQPCSGRYMVGSPLFRSVTVSAGGTATVLQISATNNLASATPYVKSVSINGSATPLPEDGFFVDSSCWTKRSGGAPCRLDFVMESS